MRHLDARTLEERSSVHAYPPENSRNGVRQSSDTCASGFQYKMAGGWARRRAVVHTKDKTFFGSVCTCFPPRNFTSSGLTSNGTGRIAGLSGSMECLFIHQVRADNRDGLDQPVLFEKFPSLHISSGFKQVINCCFQYGMIEGLLVRVT